MVAGVFSKVLARSALVVVGPRHNPDDSPEHDRAHQHEPQGTSAITTASSSVFLHRAVGKGDWVGRQSAGWDPARRQLDAWCAVCSLALL